MNRESLGDKVNLLFQEGKWAKARKLLKEEREKDPTDHWVLTQLGVAYYESKRYEEALEIFLESLKIVPDCPLTLWNVAGALSSLDRDKDAIPIYSWLLKTKTSPTKDSCWESKEWADALKTDCMYRLGLCFEYLDDHETAGVCYLQYMNLIATGIKGTYSVDDVLKRIQCLRGVAGPKEGTRNLHNAIKTTLRAIEHRSTKDRNSSSAPRLNERSIVPEILSASKR